MTWIGRCVFGVFLLADLFSCARILLISEQLNSHLAESQEIGRELASRGHSVYLLVERGYANLDRVLRPGIEVITYDALPRPESLSSAHLTKLVMESRLTASYFAAKALHDCTSMIRDTQLMTTLAGMRFDVAIADTLLLCPCLALIPRTLHVPFIALSATLDAWAARVPTHPAHTPVRVLRASHDMTLPQRLVNFAVMLAVEFLPTLAGADADLLRDVAPEMHSWLALLRSADLFICPTDHVLEWPRASMPHVIHTPGLTARPAEVLPDDIRRIVTSSNSGVIVVTFGSFTADLPQSVVDKLAQAFAAVSQTVIWKHARLHKTANRLSSNVHALPWLPQNDLLGDAHTVLFVTHCGNSGQYESLYHGVPMIGFPLFGDQSHNAFRMQHHGYGLQLDLLDFTADQLVSAMNEVIDNPRFRNAAQRASAIIRDRPMTSQQTAAYWIEHVLQFGSSHLRPSTLQMPWYEFFMVDIFAAVFLSFVFLVCVWKSSVAFLRRAHQYRISKS